ncbi:MAG: hypothetical protein WC679_13195 [Bacteroidales bacterium]|jgi:hypothetical protein
MNRIKIKVKSDATTYSHTEYVSDEYAICKSNPDLVALVQKVCDQSHIEDIQDVIVTSSCEW